RLSCSHIPSDSSHSAFSVSVPPRPPSSTLFPYTTLFRSEQVDAHLVGEVGPGLEVRRGGGERTVAAGEVLGARHDRARPPTAQVDRKSTRLNSSHVKISYAVFCLKKKKKRSEDDRENTRH